MRRFYYIVFILNQTTPKEKKMKEQTNELYRNSDNSTHIKLYKHSGKFVVEARDAKNHRKYRVMKVYSKANYAEQFIKSTYGKVVSIKG